MQLLPSALFPYEEQPERVGGCCTGVWHEVMRQREPEPSGLLPLFPGGKTREISRGKQLCFLWNLPELSDKIIPENPSVGTIAPLTGDFATCYGETSSYRRASCPWHARRKDATTGRRIGRNPAAVREDVTDHG